MWKLKMKILENTEFEDDDFNFDDDEEVEEDDEEL